MKSFKRMAVLILSLIFFITSQSAFTVSAQDPSLTSRKDFLWGVGLHAPAWSSTYSPTNLEMQLHQAAEMGCKIIRTGIATSIGHTDKTVRLANEYGMKVLLTLGIPGKTTGENYDLELIEQTFRMYATRYDGKHGYGKVDYIQIDNEMDNFLLAYGHEVGISGGHGMEIANFDAKALKNLSVQVDAAIKGVRNSGSSAKTVINIAWVHYGMLKYFEKQGVNWDVTGHDWYQDMFGWGNDKNEYYASGPELYELFKKPILICETNMWQNNFNGTTTGAPEDNYNYWDPLVKCMKNYYDKDFVIGAVFYEFWDELDHQSGNEWYGEAHFGFVKVNPNGTFKGFKPIYERVQKMIGGGTVKQLDWSKVQEKYKEEEDEELEAPIYNGTVSRPTKVTSTVVHVGSDSSNNASSNSTTASDSSTLKETFIEETDPALNSGSKPFFTTPIIICLIVAGVIVLAAIGVGVFFIVRKPKAVTEETETEE